MRLVLLIPSACAVALALSSCGNNTGGSGGEYVGPFDSAGNYREDWVDNPKKWRKTGSVPSPHDTNSDRLPEIAKSEQPPQNSNPLPTPTPKPAPAVSRTSIPSGQTAPKPEVKVVSSRPANVKPSEARTTVTKKTSSSPAAAERRSINRDDEDEKPVVRSKPKPKTITKAKPKPKPKSVRYVVKKGDSLSTIASKTGSSVSAIKSENGISGSLIRPGQTLTIPKR